MSALAIYIPSVYPNITESMISKTFHRMEIGKVKHVELISQGKTNKAHVYIDEMYDTEAASSVASDIKRHNGGKLSYARNEHVYWILLQSRREYDGKSNAGEFVDSVEFTDEEIAFMEAHSSPDFSLVDAKYAQQLEADNYHLRNTIAQLQMNFQLMQNHNMQLTNVNAYMDDVITQWISYAETRQHERLGRAIRRYGGIEENSENKTTIQEEHHEDGGKMNIGELETN